MTNDQWVGDAGVLIGFIGIRVAGLPSPVFRPPLPTADCLLITGHLSLVTKPMFHALQISEPSPKNFVRSVVQRNVDELPAGDVLVRVHYSGLNYKDALSATGNKGVTKAYPHTPGIDAGGVVEASAVDGFAPGDEVIVTSFDLGMNTPGGFGQYIRVPAGWVVKKPRGLTLRESMVLGTAGYTAAMCLQRLDQMGVKPGSGEVLVTGATGGVGSCAVAMLARLGYNVAAATGKPAEAGWLTALGANSVIARDELTDNSKPLYAPRWAGVVDTVGGTMLANALKSTRPNGCVTACGLVQSADLSINVFPFILRGVALIGADSQSDSIINRRALWGLLADAWKPASVDALINEEVALDGLSGKIDQILKGGMRGRVLVNLT
jgi:acrylyl-CoA reductase (NADPH)